MGISSSELTAGGYTVCTMNTVIRRARHMSLVLLVMAVVYHGHLRTDYSGATPGSGRLTRVSRDLMRRAGGETIAEVAASDDDQLGQSTR